MPDITPPSLDPVDSDRDVPEKTPPAEGRGDRIDRVDEAGLDSFPASDAPTWWAGPPAPPAIVLAPTGQGE